MCGWSPVSSEDRRRQDERGSVAVLVAAGLTALVGLAALLVDAGRLYVTRSRLSAVADAAALAGAPLLPDDPDGAVQTAARYLEANGVAPAAAAIEADPARSRLRVSLRADEPLYLAPVLGHFRVSVPAEAVAARQVLAGTRGAVPLGVPEGTYAYGELVTLKGDSGEGRVSPGNFRALAFEGRGANRYEQHLREGFRGWLRVGDAVETEPGVMTGPTRRAVEARIQADPDATFRTVRAGSPRLVTVPIVRGFPNGRGEVTVVAFGVFFLEDVDGGRVTGRFLRFLTTGEGSDGAPDYGAYVIRLVR